jgi:hypothetical protein
MLGQFFGVLPIDGDWQQVLKFVRRVLTRLSGRGSVEGIEPPSYR